MKFPQLRGIKPLRIGVPLSLYEIPEESVFYPVEIRVVLICHIQDYTELLLSTETEIVAEELGIRRIEVSEFHSRRGLEF